MQVNSIQPLSPATLEGIILNGDLSKLSPQQKIEYVTGLCNRLGLDPATQPLQLVTLQGKQVAYAGRGCAAQLNQLHGLSHSISSQEKVDDVYIVTDRCTGKDGRVTEEVGVVTISGLKGDMLANAIMKARTKAMRRATLSHVGLGMLDEAELDTVKDAKPVQVDTRMKAEPAPQDVTAEVEWSDEERKEAKVQVAAYCDELISRGYTEAEAGKITKTVYNSIGDIETPFIKWADRFVAWCDRADKKYPPVVIAQGDPFEEEMA